MELIPSEAALLSALATARDLWLESANSSLIDPAYPERRSNSSEAWAHLSRALATAEDREAFQSVLRELLSGMIHSSLVTLDGGSVLAETTTLSIYDDSGNKLKSFLNEYWPEFSGEIAG